MLDSGSEEDMIVPLLPCCPAQSDLAAGEPKKLAGEMKFSESAAADGMKVDEKGNLYLATGGKIEIFAPDAKPLSTIAMPELEVNGKKLREGPANLVFDGKTIFITARTGLYSVEMKVAGK
jgi:gluconolactonase